MVIAKCHELDRPGWTVRAGKPVFGGWCGYTLPINVSGTPETLWSRFVGARIFRVGVGDRGFEVSGEEDEATHALVFIDLGVDFLYTVQPQLDPDLSYVLWTKGKRRLMLIPEGAEFRVSVQGLWVPSPIGLSFYDAPIVVERTFHYAVGRNGVVYHDRTV